MGGECPAGIGAGGRLDFQVTSIQNRAFIRTLARNWGSLGLMVLKMSNKATIICQWKSHEGKKEVFCC